MERVRVVSVKMPEEVYKEMLLRVPEGERSNFIRDAIMEKLQKTPKPDKILELEQRMGKMEREFSEIPYKLGTAHVRAGKNKPTHVLHRRNRPQNNRLPHPL
jgi:Arc/MetJ-type ribon-helix-helix transcriptional regulator